MHTNKAAKPIPQQEKGASSDTVSAQQFDTPEEARAFYAIVKQRLLNVNDWQQWAGAATATFQLTDADGNDVERTAQEGDHFKIDIPGPGSRTGDGFDWVQVQTISENTSPQKTQISIQVKPATNPTNERQDIAHFFGAEASSCFMAVCEGSEVRAEVHGRNETPNTGADMMIDKARNAAVASGAAAAFAKLQWKSLVTGLVQKEA